jgi:hypothetical protein
LEINDFHYFTFLLLISIWAVYSYLMRGNRGPLACAVIAVVILCDLYAFNRTPVNRMEKQARNQDAMHEMVMTLPPVADFLRDQPGPFRVHYDASFPHTGMGNVYGIQGTFGASVTMLDDYWRAIHGPNGMCLFNVRYVLTSGADRGVPPVFSSGPWQVYDQPSPCPRAWVVHEVVVESPETVRHRMQHEELDVLRVAYLSESLPQALGPAPETPAAITYGVYRADRFELTADVSATGLLVLSEVGYPGWAATVNGEPAHIYRVNGVLRGVIVSPGSNHVVMEYRPASVRYGAALSLTAFLSTFLFAAIMFFRDRS